MAGPLPPPTTAVGALAPEAAAAAGLAGAVLIAGGMAAHATGETFARNVENLWQKHIDSVQSEEFKIVIQSFPGTTDFANNASLRAIADKYFEVRNLAKDADFVRAGHDISADAKRINLSVWNTLPAEARKR